MATVAFFRVIAATSIGCGEVSPAATEHDHQMGQCMSWDFDGPVIARIAPQFIGYRPKTSSR
ncbi:hypothetical protein QTI66_37195 [Variovorax sp. J22R133]|uniref:hypothetical protein n=1 Tax=Variovorax brevis TaxID=3053503 RepID=UPI00257756EB|nr:hypothetical protein [Variovorax sp. J22R133]MDM0117743.1 hypothetical protein [Variovorax sp. J22R133]